MFRQVGIPGGMNSVVVIQHVLMFPDAWDTGNVLGNKCLRTY